MALFELFIPSSDPEGFNITARVRAESWLQALRNGLAKLGDTADVQNIMVDITETSIDVTEPASGRVFRIRELVDDGGGTAASPAAAPPPAAKAPPPAAKAPPAAAPPPAAKSPPPAGKAPPAAAPPPAVKAPPPAAKAPPAAAPPPAVKAPPPVAKAPPPAAPPPKAAPAAAQAVPRTRRPPARIEPPAGARIPSVSMEAVPGAPSGPLRRPPMIGRTKLATPAQRFQAGDSKEEGVTQQKASEAAGYEPIGRGEEQKLDSVEDLLSELFELTQAVYKAADLNKAADYILDLAMSSVPAESGAVFIADINDQDLFFAAARGPKAGEVMGFRVPMGQGIVGFSAQEGVSLAVSDVHRDPRFYKQISQSLGYETRSIACAPVQSGGRVFGAVELINKNRGTQFNSNEVSILNFLAHEFADYLVNTGQTGD